MNDLVCIKIRDRQRGVVHALTWGRLFDAVESDQLLQGVKIGVSAFGVNEVIDLELCDSLASGAHEPYFYEALFSFAQQPIPYGPKYKKWVQQKRSEIIAGKSLFVISARANSKRTGRQARPIKS